MTVLQMATPVNCAAEAIAIDGIVEAPITDAFLEAIQALELTDRQLATLLRMSPSQFSRQKTNSEGHYLQVQRFDVLSPARRDQFLECLIAALVRRRPGGMRPAGQRDRALADAMRALAAALDPQPSLPLDTQEDVPCVAC